MINRIGKSKGRIALVVGVFLVLPWIGWNTLPKFTPSTDSANRPADSHTISQPLAANELAASSVERGQGLFMGKLHFENDGPPCMGCHNVGSNGILGGGAMGPDLTDVSTRRNQPELAAILSNSAAAKAPVMKPIYVEHPLTAEEQADLLAFINASVGQPETNREWWVIGISLAGFLAAVVLIELVYHRRLHGVRKPMVRQAYSRK